MGIRETSHFYQYYSLSHLSPGHTLRCVPECVCVRVRVRVCYSKSAVKDERTYREGRTEEKRDRTEVAEGGGGRLETLLIEFSKEDKQSQRGW